GPVLFMIPSWAGPAGRLQGPCAPAARDPRLYRRRYGPADDESVGDQVGGTMTVRVGINGFGRIGRAVLRRARAPDRQAVAINDITAARTLAHLLRHDSTYGPFGVEVTAGPDHITVDGREIPVTAHREPAEIDWAATGADVVIEASGRFRTREAAAAHLT